MFIFKKHLFVTMLCLLFTISYVHRLPAEEETGKQPTESGGKSAPSYSIKGSNITITPAAKPAGQQEVQGGGGKGMSPGGNQAHLAIDSLDYNVGEVWEGEDIVHTFIVKNTGTAQLDITNVKAG